MATLSVPMPKFTENDRIAGPLDIYEAETRRLEALTSFIEVCKSKQVEVSENTQDEVSKAICEIVARRLES